jgi:hypothetical protein
MHGLNEFICPLLLPRLRVKHSTATQHHEMVANFNEIESKTKTKG